MDQCQLPEYTLLLQRSKEITGLNQAIAVLHWDVSTHMPAKNSAYRASQCAYLQGLAHKLRTAPEVGTWLAVCEDAGWGDDPSPDLSDLEAVPSTNVRGWRRDYDLATRLPQALVEETSRVTGEAYTVWVEAREKSDFSLFAPWLNRIVSLKRQSADCLGFAESRYDALLDEYEMGSTTRHLKPIFADLITSLGYWVPRLLAKTADSTGPTGPFPVSGQKALNQEIAQAVGYDFGAGRIDTTVHPFCTTLGPHDVRILTRYHESDFFASTYGILHEAGHGMYEQGVSHEAYGTPAAESVSLGIHESQSRLWENQVGRSRLFWEYWYKKALSHLPSLKQTTPEALWRWANRVAPSPIRVEADEATYHLHVALRFEVEEQLIAGSLEPNDVPAYWNERFEKILGLRIENDAQGCLQDVHWSHGLFGYFPTYTLGSLNAAQLFAAARREIPGLDLELAQGEYQNLLAWLRQKIHRAGRRLTPHDLMIRATGEPTNPQYFFSYLEEKLAQF